MQAPLAQAAYFEPAPTRPYNIMPLRPLELDIPAMQAYIPIIDVGVTSAGSLDVPHNFVQAGWYDKGPVPGTTGTAVIDGHVDNGGTHPTIDGVFKQLDSLSVGDFMNVRLSDGSIATFQITGMATYPYTNFPSRLIFGQTGKTLLNIITCQGTWLGYADTYSERLVVTAERIS